VPAREAFHAPNHRLARKWQLPPDYECNSAGDNARDDSSHEKQRSMSTLPDEKSLGAFERNNGRSGNSREPDQVRKAVNL